MEDLIDFQENILSNIVGCFHELAITFCDEFQDILFKFAKIYGKNKMTNFLQEISRILKK